MTEANFATEALAVHTSEAFDPDIEHVTAGYDEPAAVLSRARSAVSVRQQSI